MAKDKVAGILRTSPEFKVELIKMKAEKEQLQGEMSSIPDITKDILRCPSWQKVKEEVNLKKRREEFDLRK